MRQRSAATRKNPNATAISSRSVDFPEPFSPTKNVTGVSNRNSLRWRRFFIPEGCRRCRAARALTALHAPRRLLTWPGRRQRGYMAPRLRHDIDQQWARDFRQSNEDGGIVAVVPGEIEGEWIQLHQDITLADRSHLQHQNRCIVAESGEKPTIQEEGRR